MRLLVIRSRRERILSINDFSRTTIFNRIQSNSKRYDEGIPIENISRDGMRASKLSYYLKRRFGTILWNSKRY